MGTTSGVGFNSINLLFGTPLTPEPGPIGSPPPLPSTPQAYTGTVTIEDSFSITRLVVECGAIKQADDYWLTPPVPYAPHAGTLTITSSLYWTGGTLNNNDVAGHIDLAPGAVGLAEPSFTNPGINGTVYLGSTLSLKGTDPESSTPGLGSTLDVFKGMYKLVGGDGFVAEGWSKISFMAEPTLTGNITIDGTPKDNPRPRIKVEKKSICEIFATNRAEGVDDLAVVRIVQNKDEEESGGFYNSGQTSIKGGTELKIESGKGSLHGYGQSGSEAVTSLEAGSKITSDSLMGAHITKGRFEVKTRLGGNGQPTATQSAAVVSATNAALAFSLGVDAVLTMPDAGPYNTLYVEGRFMSRGEVRLAINGTTTDCDKVRATNGTYFLPIPLAIWRFSSARGVFNQP